MIALNLNLKSLACKICQAANIFQEFISELFIVPKNESKCGGSEFLQPLHLFFVTLYTWPRPAEITTSPI